MPRLPPCRAANIRGMRNIPLACLLALGAAISPNVTAANLLEHPEVAGAIRLYEGWVRGQMQYRNLPGLAVGVVVDQDLVWAKGFGVADVNKLTPVTPQTLFRMASHTKLFTAMAIMQLRDAGKLRLSDPVSQHLPWFRIQPAVEGDLPVTIEDLLTHGSGLPREAAAPYWITFQFPTRQQVEQTITTQRAAYAPQVRWKYSNLAYALAGYVVESVSGKPWDQYVRTSILDPLGMRSTTIDENLPGLATGYGRRMPDGSRRVMGFMNTSGIAPAAGLTSNIEDMARFVAFQMRGDPRILRPATLREMHRVRFLQSNWAGGWGLGFSVTRRNDKTYVGHGGSLAGYKTHTSINLDDKIGVIVLSNADDTVPDRFVQQAHEVIGKAILKARPKPAEPRWDPSWSRFAGLYRTIWGDQQVVEMDRRLVLIDPLAEAPADSALELRPGSDGAFLLEGPNGGSPVGEPVRFEERDGKVVRMIVGYSPADRVEP